MDHNQFFNLSNTNMNGYNFQVSNNTNSGQFDNLQPDQITQLAQIVQTQPSASYQTTGQFQQQHMQQTAQQQPQNASLEQLQKIQMMAQLQQYSTGLNNSNSAYQNNFQENSFINQTNLQQQNFSSIQTSFNQNLPKQNYGLTSSIGNSYGSSNSSGHHSHSHQFDRKQKANAIQYDKNGKKKKKKSNVKRPMTAYLYFVSKFRQQLKDNGDPIPKAKEMTQECAAKWRTMNDDDKTEYMRLAEKDRERWTREKNIEKKPRDPLRPKRPPSAYFLFLTDFRISYPSKNDPAKEITKKAGAKWNSLSEEEKSPYVIAAHDKRIIWEAALKEYKRNEMSKIVAAKNKEESMNPVIDNLKNDVETNSSSSTQENKMSEDHSVHSSENSPAFNQPVLQDQHKPAPTAFNMPMSADNQIHSVSAYQLPQSNLPSVQNEIQPNPTASLDAMLNNVHHHQHHQN